VVGAYNFDVMNKPTPKKSTTKPDSQGTGPGLPGKTRQKVDKTKGSFAS